MPGAPEYTPDVSGGALPSFAAGGRGARSAGAEGEQATVNAAMIAARRGSLRCRLRSSRDLVDGSSMSGPDGSRCRGGWSYRDHGRIPQPSKKTCNTTAPAADHSCVKHPHPHHAPAVGPQEGIIDMVCHRFGDEPDQVLAYATFAAEVDSYLANRDLTGWAQLDVAAFIAQSADTSTEQGTLCCMMAAALPWMVRAGDLSRAQALQKCHALLEVTPDDPEARISIHHAMNHLGETDSSVTAGLPH